MNIWSPIVQGLTTYLGVTPPKPEHEKRYVLGIMGVVTVLVVGLICFGYFLLTTIASSGR